MTSRIAVGGNQIGNDKSSAAMQVKDPVMPYILEKDAGFCSGGEEDDSEEGTVLNSDDSGVKTEMPPKLSLKNKRKCAEPFKIVGAKQTTDRQPTAPLKKRIRFESEAETETSRSSEGSDAQKEPCALADNNAASPFRPWSLPGRHFGFSPDPVVSLRPLPASSESPPSPAQFPISPFHTGIQTVLSPSNTPHQDEPLSLVKNVRNTSTTSSNLLRQRKEVKPVILINEGASSKPIVNFNADAEPRVPPHPAVRALTIAELNSQPREPQSSASSQHGFFSVDSLLTSQASNQTAIDNNLPSTSTSSKDRPQKTSSKDSKEQRNYKNMTRERRIEANARERTRVHTISAAFDTLRKSIPSYSHNQKLSKLSVLRIACSYIMTLSRVAGEDYSADRSSPSLAECISTVTKTIQTEGKLRKKKDDV